MIGSGLMPAADWLCRVIAFPYRLPIGLFVSLIGAPSFIWLLRRGR